MTEGERQLRLIDAEAWLSCIRGLPIAASIVSLREGRLYHHALNPAFDRIARVDGPLCRAVAERLGAGTGAGTGADVHNFPWDEPAFGGRHFQVALTPIGRAQDARYLLTLIDRTGQFETERLLRFGMVHDTLTGLPNRVAFGESLEQAVACDGEDARFAVIAIDLTRFSRINEGVGALAGDELILTVARRLLETVRPPDLLARLAGDEFGVLMTLRDGPGDALHLARRLEQSLAVPLHLSDLEIRVDCAIGCAIHQDGAASAQDMLRHAQFALKRAKVSRRIEVYRPGEASAARRRFSLETELRRAIEREEIEVAFQPLVGLRDGRMVGCEALARWTHADHGVVPPGEFITVAEESGLIVPLGRLMVDRAAAAIAGWTREGGAAPPFYVGVNVSPVQLLRDAPVAMIEAALATHGIDGHSLTLELTESSIVADPGRAASVLTALKALGCRIAMDDFGTGFSNLASLQRLPIDILKIDQAFVRDILDDPDAAAIVRAILSLARALGMATVAEGIESAGVIEAIAGYGCEVGQGYHFARALPADELLAFYRARAASSSAIASTRA